MGQCSAGQTLNVGRTTRMIQLSLTALPRRRYVQQSNSMQFGHPVQGRQHAKLICSQRFNKRQLVCSFLLSRRKLQLTALIFQRSTRHPVSSLMQALRVGDWQPSHMGDSLDSFPFQLRLPVVAIFLHFNSICPHRITSKATAIRRLGVLEGTHR